VLGNEQMTCLVFVTGDLCIVSVDRSLHEKDSVAWLGPGLARSRCPKSSQLALVVLSLRRRAVSYGISACVASRLRSGRSGLAYKGCRGRLWSKGVGLNGVR
jgi:hypothetical protein